MYILDFLLMVNFLFMHKFCLVKILKEPLFI